MALDSKHLLLLSVSPLRGGAEDYCLAIARGAVAAGFEVDAAFSPSEEMASLAHDMQSLGVRYHALNIVDVGSRHTHSGFIPRFLRTYRLLINTRPNVALVVLCGLQYGLAPLLACAVARVPAVVVFQMVRSGVYLSPPQRWVRALARKKGQTYVAVSSENQYLLSRVLRMPSSDIQWIANGADPAVFACTPAERAAGRAKLREELGLPPETRLLLTVGRLSHQKGHDLLVPVMAHVIERHPDVRFIWAGEGPNEKDLKALLEQYGVEKFTTLLGRRGDIPHLLNSSDLFVHPTRFEGQPFSMLEAMAAGLPIVTTQASGITEVLEDRVHGLLGRVEDVRDLRENLFFALDHPDDMRAMAERARLRLEAFTEAKMIERTLALLTDSCR